MKYAFILKKDDIIMTMYGSGKNFDKTIKQFKDNHFVIKEVDRKAYEKVAGITDSE